MAIQFRRGNKGEFLPSNLLPAEPAFALDTHEMYVGDGDGNAQQIPLMSQVQEAADTAATAAATAAVAAALADTGWQTLTFTAPVSNYGAVAANAPRVRKIGKLVEIRGIATHPQQSVAASATLFTLPAGFRPATVPVYKICQGYGNATWMLTINTNGAVQVARYRTIPTAVGDFPRGTYTPFPADVWLPFAATFFID